MSFPDALGANNWIGSWKSAGLITSISFISYKILKIQILFGISALFICPRETNLFSFHMPIFRHVRDKQQSFGKSIFLWVCHPFGWVLFCIYGIFHRNCTFHYCLLLICIYEVERQIIRKKTNTKIITRILLLETGPEELVL